MTNTTPTLSTQCIIASLLTPAVWENRITQADHDRIMAELNNHAKLVEALASIAENLQNRAMSAEQEKAFRNSPACEAWRVYLSSLVICARNEAAFALANLK